MPVDRDRAVDDLLQVVGDADRFGLADHVGHEHDELVATQPGQLGSRWAGLGQAAGQTAISSSSPTLWPSESLITLKRSRSRNSTATPRPDARFRVEPADARAVASTNAQRLGRPVERVVAGLVGQLGLDRRPGEGLAEDAGRAAQRVGVPGLEHHSRPTDSKPRNPMSWPWSDSGTASADCTPA